MNPATDPYKETFETWNKVASLYQEKFMDLDLYNESYDFICDSIGTPNAKLLEIGCGPGNITKYLLQARPDFDILGIDIAPNMIGLAKANNPTASFAVMDVRQIDEIKSTFDGIICGFCLPYISPADNEKFISNSCTLLNEGGLIYISFVEGNPEESEFRTSSTGDRAFFYYYNLQDLKAQLSKNLFTDFKISTVHFTRSETESETHTVLTARKKTS